MPIGALLPSTHASRIEDELLGLSDGTPGQVFPLRHSPVLKPVAGETLEVQDPESGDWSTWERREDFVSSTEFDRHFVLDPVSGERRARPRDPRDRRRLDPVRRGAAEGRRAALHALPPRRRPARQRHRRRAVGAAQPRSPASTRSPTRSPRVGGVDAEALEHARQRASMEIRTRYRAVTAEDFEFLAGEASPRVARAVCIPPERRRRGAAAHRPARLSRPTASSPTPSWCRTPRADGGGRRVPRRAPPDRHDGPAAAVQVPRPVGHRQPAGLAARRHRARRGGRLARALHVPQPAGRRLGDRARRGLGRSGARSTRASCTASCTPSTASSS